MDNLDQWECDILLRALEIFELATKAATDLRPSKKAMQLSDCALIRQKLLSQKARAEKGRA